MTATKRAKRGPRGPRGEGVNKGGRPREVEGDAVEFTIRLGTVQLGWLESRYPSRTRAGMVRDLVDEVRGGSPRRRAHWPARTIVGAHVDPTGAGVALVALSMTGSRPKLVASRVFTRDDAVAAERLAADVRGFIVGVEAGGSPVDLAAIGYLTAPASTGRHVTRDTGVMWGLTFAAMRSAALGVEAPTLAEITSRAGSRDVSAVVHAAESAVAGFETLDRADVALVASAVFVALAGLDREAARREAE